MSIKSKLYEAIHKQPYGTKAMVDIHDIIVGKAFKKTILAQWKIDRANEFFIAN
jgi:hypothetical protein